MDRSSWQFVSNRQSICFVFFNRITMFKYILRVAVLFCLVGYLSAIVPVPKQLDQMTSGFRQQCISETGVSPDILTKLDNGGDVPDDSNFKCYVKCIVGLIGGLSDKGIDLDKLASAVPADVQDLAKQLVDKCKDTQNANDPCEAGYQFVKCFHDNFADKFFVI